MLLATCVLAAPARAQEDYERMEQFLDRLGLADLRIAQLEQTLEAPIAQQRKQQLARELADMYAERLMASSDDKARYDDTLRRITTLLQRHAQANTTALQVMLLQADYNRAESLIATWIGEPDNLAPRDEAQQILARITPQLVTLQTQLNKNVDTLLTEMDDMLDGEQLQAKEVELRRVQAITARATYFAGWSNYYLGLANQAGTNAVPYTTARDIFLNLLGLDESVPEDLEAEWLGLESIWRARAVIGLGLSLAACGDVNGSARCFKVLQHGSVPHEIREQAPYWFVRALLGVQQWARAEAYARQEINNYQSPPTQGKVSLCVALVRAGFGEAASQPNQQRRQLGNLGLVGLARLGQLGAINALIDKYQIKADSSSGFVLLWAAGQQQFAAAEKSKSSAGYETAVQTLQKALRAPESKTLAGPAARCRYTLGWSFFRLNKWEDAAREFSNAFPGLNESKDELAVESAWMAFAAYRKLADSEPRFVTKASNAQKRLEQHFPNHSYAQRAGYEMNKLMEKSDPTTMIAQLEAVKPGDENYALARYDLCLLLHRLWTGERGDKQKGSKRLAELQGAVDKYLATVKDEDALRQLKICLLAADAALHHSEPRPDIAAAMLTRADRFASQLPISQPQVVEFHYRLLELAAAQGDAAQRRQQAQWIADHADGSRYEQAALVIVANGIDRQIRDASPSDRKTLNTQAFSVYSRLVEVFGGSQEKLAASKNAQVSASRLAHYAQQIGQSAKAASLLDQLLQVQPRDRRYLQRAVQAHSQAGQYARALHHVRTLLAGLPTGSQDWYEAKYLQLAALSHTDQQQAQKVYRQFKLLHPDLGGTAWTTKFTDLARSW